MLRSGGLSASTAPGKQRKRLGHRPLKGRGQQGHDAAPSLGRGNCFVAEGRLGETAGRTGHHESIPQGIGQHEDQLAA